MPARTASCTERMRTGWPRTSISPASAGAMPKRASASSVRPAPMRPVRPRISPSCRSNETSAKLFRRVSLRTRSSVRRGPGVAWKRVSVRARPVMSADQLRLRQLGGRQAGHHLAVAQHGDALGHGEDLVELVAHEEHRDAARLQIAHHREQAVDVALAQRGGGLVEDEQAQVAGEGTADGDQLLLAHRQLAHLGVEVERHLDARHGGAGDAPHLVPVVQGAALLGQVAQGDVLGHASGSGRATGPGR